MEKPPPERGSEDQLQPLVLPHSMQRWQAPLRTMMAPQVLQLGASPMSYMCFMASEAWRMPRSSTEGIGDRG